MQNEHLGPASLTVCSIQQICSGWSGCGLMSLANTIRTDESEYASYETRSEQTSTSTYILWLVRGFAVAALPPTGFTDSGLHGFGGLNNYPRK